MNLIYKPTLYIIDRVFVCLSVTKSQVRLAGLLCGPLGQPKAGPSACAGRRLTYMLAYLKIIHRVLDYLFVCGYITEFSRKVSKGHRGVHRALSCQLKAATSASAGHKWPIW